MHTLIEDLCHGFRLLRKTPGFALLAALTLALGLGAASSIFSVVDAVLLKPLPFREPERIVAIWEKTPALTHGDVWVAGTNFLEWSRLSRSFAAMGAVQTASVNLTAGPRGHLQPEELKAERVTAGLFPMLGAQPVLGRGFLAEEDRPGGPLSALLSYELWQRRFGGDPSVVGQAVVLRGQSHHVAGVMPPGFAIVTPGVDLWMPLALNAADARVVARRSLTVLGRLKTGVPLEQARAEMRSIGAALEREYPALNRGCRPLLVPLDQATFGNVERPLLVLAGAVGLLLLIACANVANLLLARGAGRKKEMSIRAAMGATRGRMIRQLLSESLILSLGGGVVGLVLARGGLALATRLGPRTIPRLADARFDGRLFAFALAAAVISGVLFGIVPAIQASATDLRASLMEGGRGGTAGRPGRKLRNMLVISELALATLVLIGSGLLMRSFLKLRTADFGFDPEGVLTFRIPLFGGRNTAVEQRKAFAKDALSRISAVPGVLVAGLTNELPLGALGSGATFRAAVGPAPAEEQKPIGLVRTVSPGYFRAMRIPLIAGRELNESDDSGQAPAVLLVNRTLARRIWPDGSNPLGRRLAVDMAQGVILEAEVVGVVGDVKPQQVENAEWPTLYFPYARQPMSTVQVAVRAGGNPMALASAVERVVHQIDPEQVVADLRTMDERVERAIGGFRFNAVLLGIFAGIAFVLCAAGVYGVVSYDVSQRTNEIGIRVALGASSADVLRLIVGEGARLAAGGIGIGLAAAFALTRSIAGMLYGVEPTDAYTFAGMAVLLGAVALAASYLPSRRAMAVDPMAALRHE